MQNCDDEVENILSLTSSINNKLNADQYCLDLINLLYKDVYRISSIYF